MRQFKTEMPEKSRPGSQGRHDPGCTSLDANFCMPRIDSLDLHGGRVIGPPMTRASGFTPERAPRPCVAALKAHALTLGRDINFGAVRLHSALRARA